MVLMKDIDMSELDLKSFINASFFTRNCIYVYLFQHVFLRNSFFYELACLMYILKALKVLTLFGLVFVHL